MGPQKTTWRFRNSEDPRGTWSSDHGQQTREYQEAFGRLTGEVRRRPVARGLLGTLENEAAGGLKGSHSFVFVYIGV